MNRYITVSFLIFGIMATKAQIKQTDTNEIEAVELFGDSNKHPEGLELITRLPIKPRDRVQSISVISHKVIENLGGLTLLDVTKNVPGVTLFSNYGGGSESMSMRGYRGVPVLKNGVALDQDFRTAGMLTDMQGVESIQVIKGSAAVTQGVGNGLGSAGGVINVVTKRPKFITKSSVGLRVGSWDTYRPTFDLQRVFGNDDNVAFRLNGAYQTNKSFRAFVEGERFYINPSLAYKLDDRTDVILEMDYMDDERTPDRGTVNLAPGDTKALYIMPKGSFLGFKEDYSRTKTLNLSTNINTKLSDNFYIRTSYMNSSKHEDDQAMSISNYEDKDEIVDWTKKVRRYSKGKSAERNKVLQFDLVGQDLKTGFLKHTFQVGFDWKESEVISTDYTVYKNSISKENRLSGRVNKRKKEKLAELDIIDILNGGYEHSIYNLQDKMIFVEGKTTKERTPSVGVMAQDVITLNEYIKANLGLRYSRLNGYNMEDKDSWDPSIGVILSPVENINVFGSYATTTSLRSANNPIKHPTESKIIGNVGPSTTKQFETGIKTDWFNERLRFNATLFDIITDNLSHTILDGNFDEVKIDGRVVYGLSGKLKRKGLELELIGRILPNLQIMSGWAYLDAGYKDSQAYVDGSAPMNAPKHTANAWLNYRFERSFLKGIDIGAGVYYIGERPSNEWSKKTYNSMGHVNGLKLGEKPFNMKEFASVDAQIGYTYKNTNIRVFVKNILDAIGYTSYFRGGYINQMPPRNISAQFMYSF